MKCFTHIGYFRFVCLAMIFFRGGVVTCKAVPPDADDVTLNSMCRAGLSDSAISYAVAQRQLVEKNDEQYSRWTQRLMECEAQAALRTATEAEIHWSRCAELYDSFAKTHAKNRRIPWLSWQMQRCKLMRAQNELAKWLAAPAAAQHRERALEIIRDVLSGLEALETDLKIRQPLAAQLKPNDPAQAPAEQIAQLRLETVLLRCEAFLARSRLYESGSRDRIGAATEVEEQATSVLDRAGAEWASRPSLEVARAAAWLELGQAQEGITQLQLLAQSNADPAIRTRAAVIAAEWLVANQQLSQAHVFTDLLKNFDGGVEAELADLRLRIAELARTPKEKKDTELNKLLEQARTIGTRYGDYWRSRADSILVGTLSKDSMQQSSTTIDLVAVEVRQLLAAGDTKAAIEKLVTTSRNEAASNRGGNAIRAASQAAALLHRQKDWLQSADVLQSTTLKFPAISGAAEAHLLAIWGISQALRATPKDKTLPTRYESMLREHLSVWPSSSTVDRVLPWLQEWLSATNGQSELMPIYRKLAEQAEAPNNSRNRLHGWLEEALLCNSDERLKEISALNQSVADGRLKPVESTARVVSMCATVWPNWPEPKLSSDLIQESRQLAVQVEEPVDHSLVSSSLLLFAIRDFNNAEASVHAKNVEASHLSTIALGTFLQACITALDAQDQKANASSSPDDQPTWIRSLVIGDDRIAELLKHSDDRMRVAALRWQIQMGISTTENLTRLQEICSEHTTEPYLQMQLAEVLTKLGKGELAESNTIAKKVAASNSKNSELHLWARWRLLRNQQLAGEQVAAQRAAKLLLATQAIESELWKSRIAKIAGNK